MSYATRDGLRWFAFGERQVFSTATRTLRRVFPLRQFVFLGRTALPGRTCARTHLWSLTAGRYSFLTGFILLSVVIARALGNGYTVSGLGQR